MGFLPFNAMRLIAKRFPAESWFVSQWGVNNAAPPRPRPFIPWPRLSV